MAQARALISPPSPISVREHGHVVRTTREPGGTELGERLRALLLDSAQVMHLETEALLMFAARREHLDKIIEPALSKGEWVICDRFTDATFAYQGSGRGADWARLQLLEEWVQHGRQPDLTLLFDVAPAIGRARAGRIKPPDRFERERDDFSIACERAICGVPPRHQRGYASLTPAAASPVFAQTG